MQSTTLRLTEAHDKTLRINLDRSRYGTFAEIGAGQEVAALISERRAFGFTPAPPLDCLVVVRFRTHL